VLWKEYLSDPAISIHILINIFLAIGALFALKRKLMLEKELAKIDGQMTLLIQ